MSARYWWCKVCAGRCHRVPESNRWVHDEPGADHGPIPTPQRPAVPA